MPTEQCVFLILYIHSIYGILYIYTFLSFDDGIRQKICSRMLYGIAWGTRGWVYISSQDVGYNIPSLSARYLVLSMMTVVACTAGHITVACVMQVREEHAMGHDSGGI